MGGIRWTGIVLIVASVLALLFGGFSYSGEVQQAKLGPLELSVRENKTVNFPVWAGLAGIAIGAALLWYGSSKR